MRYASTALAAAAMAASLSHAQIEVRTPKVGAHEMVGLETSVLLDLAPGLDAGGIVRDEGFVLYAFDLLDASGQVISGTYAFNDVGGPHPYDNAMGNPGVIADMRFSLLEDALADHPDAYQLRLLARTDNGNVGYVSTPFSTDEIVDQNLVIVRPDQAPRLVSASVNAERDTLRLQFDHPLSTPDPDNDLNHTVIADVNGLDFQSGVFGGFTGAEATLTGVSNPRTGHTTPGVPPNVILFDFDPASANAFPGSALRPAYDTSGVRSAELSVRGHVGYYATPEEVSIDFAAPACPGDVNADDDVESGDLAILLTTWGAPGAGDVTGDGVTNAHDLAIILSAWGECP